MLLRLAAASAAAVLLTGAASAQPADSSATPAPAPSAGSDSATPAPAPSASADTTGYNARSTSSTVPAADLGAAKAGDPGIVSNGPVPDTPENRAKYGKPDSHAGKRTQPAGN
jgi:hypothetical protein